MLHHGSLILILGRGNLSNKSLAPIVSPDLIVRDSEYIETHLIAVPAQQKKEFLKSYETLSSWIVPRSAVQVAADDEFILYTVTTFKKYSHDFIHKCREQKWIPRDYKYKEGGRDEEKKELEKVSREERKLWGEILRLARTNWGEAVMAWIHVLVLRVFVETVLRYGLPLAFICGLVKVRHQALFFTYHTNKFYTDNAQADQEIERCIGHQLWISRRKCHWQGQERSSHQRQLRRYADCWS